MAKHIGALRCQHPEGQKRGRVSSSQSKTKSDWLPVQNGSAASILDLQAPSRLSCLWKVAVRCRCSRGCVTLRALAHTQALNSLNSRSRVNEHPSQTQAV